MKMLSEGEKCQKFSSGHTIALLSFTENVAAICGHMLCSILANL